MPSRCGDDGTISCSVNATREARSSQTPLTLLHDLVDLAALDVIHIKFPIDCQIDVSGTISLCDVLRPRGVVQVVPLVPGVSHFASDSNVVPTRGCRFYSILQNHWREDQQASGGFIWCRPYTSGCCPSHVEKMPCGCITHREL